MKIFLSGSGLICFAVLIHVVIWKIRLPKKQLSFLLKTFLSILGLWLFIVLFHMFDIYPLFTKFKKYTFAEILHITLFYISMAFSYTAAYSTIEADSPSLRIVMTIYNSGSDGMDRGTLSELSGMNKFFQSRMDRLIEDKMVSLNDGLFTILPKGRLLMCMVVLYRKILGNNIDLG